MCIRLRQRYEYEHPIMVVLSCHVLSARVPTGVICSRFLPGLEQVVVIFCYNVKAETLQGSTY